MTDFGPHSAADHPPETQADEEPSTTAPPPAPAENGTPSLPESTDAWKELLAALPARALLRLTRADRNASRIVFAGFRASADIVRTPAVLARIVEYAQHNPVFGAALASAARAPQETSAADRPAPTGPAEKPTPEEPEIAPREDRRLREKVKEQRALLKEREAHIAALEAQAAELTRERDAARSETEAERRARKDADAAAERERRLREREARRETRLSEPATPRPAERVEPPPTPTVPAPPPRLLSPGTETAMQRLLNRAKFAVVAEVARELQSMEPTDAADRGAIHSLCAAALYGLGQDAAGEEQDHIACGAFLDAGDIAAASEAFARAVSHALSGPLRPIEMALLQRTLVLARRADQMDAVESSLSRLRITTPSAYQRLRRGLSGKSRTYGALLRSLAAPTATAMDPDEAMALPTPGRTASTVTARRLVEAVDAGDENFVTCARDGIETLRRDHPAQAEALLEAVRRLHPASVSPLVNALPRPVVVDASNVARYQVDPLGIPGNGATGHLIAMRDHLLRRGFFPVLLIADANLRFLVDDREGYLALVERGAIRETPPGISADETLIAETRERHATLVSNDRMAEYGDAARRIERSGFDLFPGGMVTLTPL